MSALAGIRILDLSRLLPGPYATQLLADLGAEVIKIERPPEGDYTRTMAPYRDLGDGHTEGAIFTQNNRGKASVALNFDEPAGRTELLRLIAGADVLIESFRPGALAQRGLDYASVQPHNPRLIYCSVSGYGQTGPFRSRAGHDINYLALAGILKLNGHPDQPPALLPVLVADLAGGSSAALQIVAALVERERTGVGKYLDVALFDAAVEWMDAVTGAIYRADGENPERGAEPLTGAYPCYNLYATSDGAYMSLGALEPKFWQAFCAAVSRADLVQAQFASAAIPAVAALFQTRTRAEWVTFSLQVDCCLEPLLDLDQVWTHPQVQARGLLQGGGKVPRLGQDTERILSGENGRE